MSGRRQTSAKGHRVAESGQPAGRRRQHRHIRHRVRPPRTVPRLLRIGLSAVILCLFAFGFFVAGVIGDTILDVLTRLQLFPSLINSLFAAGGWLAAGFVLVLVVTALFGRIYCSGLCPLGTLQDVIIGLGGKRSFTYARPRRLLRWGVLAALIGTALLGSSAVMNLLEPYALFGRLTRDLVTPLAVLGSHAVSLTARLFDWFLAPINLRIDVPTMTVTLLIVTMLVIFTARHGRVFCNTLCPVGTVLSLLARYSVFGVAIDRGRCTSCGLCESVCKAGCASSAHKRIDGENCVSCFNCLEICPFDALHYGPRRPLASLASHRTRPGVSRRSFLKGLGGGTTAATAYSLFPVSFAFRKRLAGPEGRTNAPASPPGSRSIAAFTAHCVACHLCVSRCPTQVLQPSLFEYGLAGLMQPVMDYGRGFCEYECNICTRVCPTGAISPISLSHKKTIQIGTSHFIQDRCIVFTEGTACGACAEQCPTNACHMVPHENGLTKPVVENDICIGCGNCEYACPVEGGKAIYVVGREEHTLREVREPADTDRGTGQGNGDLGPWPF